MLEKLLAFDKSLFLAINGCHNEFFDHFFYIFTQKEVWIPSIIAILYAVIKTKGKNAIWIILGLALTIALADQISSGLLKPLVARLRPSHEPSLEGLVHLVNEYTGGRFGFASSHAANSFGVAAFLSLVYKNRTFSYIVIAWAILNSYSRIYIGVHYPLDIICGGLIGVASAYLFYALLTKLKPQTLTNTLINNQNNNNWFKISLQSIHIVSISLVVTVILTILLNNVLFPVF